VGWSPYPNSTTEADVEDLRRLGFQDQQIFAITLYVALRLAFATVNETLGAAPTPSCSIGCRERCWAPSGSDDLRRRDDHRRTNRRPT